MHAQVIDTFGAPDVFHRAEIATPEATPGHVVIRVAASSVNPVDCKIRRGDYAAMAPPLPAVLHGDVAGTVTAVGNGVSQFNVGDEVYGCAGGITQTPGALAEYMRADAALLAHKPRTLDFAHAAALPLVAITAWEALVERAKIGAGQRVLIHAGAGGVGHIAVQLAKARGAKVYTTASTPEKIQLARELGADGVIDYRQQSVEQYVQQYTDGAGFDIVFDTVGGDTFARSLEAVRLRGTVASILPTSTYDLTPVLRKALTIHGVFMLLPLLTGTGRAAHGALLTEVARLVDIGKIRPHLDTQRFTFAQVGAAHARLESGRAIGKVVLTQE